jgi:hypothetical protein
MVGMGTSGGVPDDGARRATASLLWEACRPSLRPAVVSAIADDGADVPWAARVALSQHAGPLLWRALASIGRLDDLGAAEDDVHADYEIRRGQAALLIPLALATATEPLRRAGLEPVVLKGPSLAARYPDPWLRPMEDIDVLLPARDHAAGLEALTNAGWRTCDGEARHDYDTVLWHPSVPHLPLELHHGLESWRERAHAVSAEDLWARRKPVEYVGVPTFGLPVEDELVMLATHAAKSFHHFQRIIWSVDFAVVIEAAATTLDWGLVAERARTSRCATPLAVALAHARRLGARVPDRVVALPARGWRRAALAPVLDEAWPLGRDRDQVAHRLRYALPDATRDRARLALGEVTARGSWHALPRAGQLARKALRGLRRVDRFGLL